MARYKVAFIKRSMREFGPDWEVVDTERNDNRLCTCFHEGDAMMIADALNKAEIE